MDENDDNQPAGADLSAKRDVTPPPPQLEQEELLKLVVRQLAEFGHTQLASVVAEQTDTAVDLPSNRLAELVNLGLQKEQELDEEGDDFKFTVAAEKAGEDEGEREKNVLYIDAEPATELRYVPNYRTMYTTSHKGPCTTAAFSQDGRFIATGSADSSLKVIDVARCNRVNSRTGEPVEKPVIRTLYDHAAPVNEVCFHPNGMVLASCSDDQTIKFFDISKPGIKRAFRYLQDTQTIRTIHFHPSGDFILAGTDHPTLRAYDVKTLQCYTMPSDAGGAHRGAITQARYSAAGNIFATSSTDGDLRVWDCVSGKCVRHFEKAHSGSPTSSVRITKSGRYLLSSGRDSVIKLWDLGSGRLVHGFEGASQATVPAQIALSWKEDFVISTDEKDNTIVFWDARTAHTRQRFAAFGTTRYIAASPTDNGFMTCSDDHRARYWNAHDQDQSGR